MPDIPATLAARDAAHLIHPVTEPREMAEHGPRIVVSAEGWHVTDDRGHRIIDGFAGLWCVAVGHGRTEIIDAVAAQLHELDYFTTFHGQSHPRAIELAERLAAMFDPSHGLNHVMFSSGGSEANETNFKLVRLYWALRGEERPVTIVSRHHGYHGLTIATMTATGLILAVGLLIAPGAIAFLMVRSFGRMLAVAVVVCMASMLAGVYASFHLDSAPAPTIVLILTSVFILALARRMVQQRRASAHQG